MLVGEEVHMCGSSAFDIAWEILWWQDGSVICAGVGERFWYMSYIRVGMVRYICYSW